MALIYPVSGSLGITADHLTKTDTAGHLNSGTARHFSRFDIHGPHSSSNPVDLLGSRVADLVAL
jgi:hypothetical protein